MVDDFFTLPVSVEETAVAAGATSFAGAVSQSGLSTDTDDATWLVPNNEAFQRVGSALTSGSLNSVLKYHLVEGGPLYTSDISKSTYSTSEGSNVHFQYANQGADLYVNTAAVLTANVIVSDGVMHIISQ